MSKEKSKEVIDVAEEVKKIDAKQLKKFQDFEEFSKNVKLALGDLLIQYEGAKSNIMSQFYDQKNKISELEKEVKDEFGENIKIDINTGVVGFDEKK